MADEIELIDDFTTVPGEVFGTIQRAEELLRSAGDNPEARQDALQLVIDMLSKQVNQIRKYEEMKAVAKLFDIKKPMLEKFVKDHIALRQSEDTDPDAPLPSWVDRDKLYGDGFIQNNKQEKNYRVGIYFNGDSSQRLKRVTNFTIMPLLHIMDAANNRRLAEVNNGKRLARVELPGRALVTKAMFEGTIIEKGAFICEGMTDTHFKRIVGWLTEEMPVAFDLVSLGWQPDGKGFFAFANTVFTKGELREYNPLGVVEVEGTHYISMGVSNLHNDYRQVDNPYENDRYLMYVKSAIEFTQWAVLFQRVYKAHAPVGISFVFITLFKDIVVQVTKCPHLYSYGPKGSGKSDFNESLLWLFFAGKNAEGNLMQAMNLNPGQVTVFSFFSALERFSNCPIALNEFDENRIEEWKFGTIKSAYDGEGRSVGDGSTGKSRKSRTQKVRCSLLILGQYLSTGDDGSVLSRSLTVQFTKSAVDSLTADDEKQWELLKGHEKKGLSSIIGELLQHRAHFAASFKQHFWRIHEDLKQALVAIGCRAETRLLRNYTCSLAAVACMETQVALPFTYDNYFQQVVKQVADHNALLKENNALAKFWKIVEFCYTRQLINWDHNNHKYVERDYSISHVDRLLVKRNNETATEQFKPKRVLVMRFNTIYPVFARSWREQTGSNPPAEGTILKYLQDQPYYIGLTPSHRYSSGVTSGFAFNYDALAEDGIMLDPTDATNTATLSAENSNPSDNSTTTTDDLPF